MPSCHGAGGLAAQHRFGARSSASMLMLGLLKLAAGLVFGRTLQSFCAALPCSVLGMLLAFSGIELALCARAAPGGDGLGMGSGGSGAGAGGGENYSYLEDEDMAVPPEDRDSTSEEQRLRAEKRQQRQRQDELIVLCVAGGEIAMDR
jgi:hypothetical protein